MNIEISRKRSILNKLKSGKISSEEAAALLKSPTPISDKLQSEALENRDEIKEVDSNLDIAIVGVSGKFPGANDLEEYWNNLCEGRNSISEVPGQRWPLTDFYDPDVSIQDRSNCKWGGFVKDIDCFDSLFFNISPKEAAIMDPQQRLFLQEAWHAIEDAGYSTNNLDGRNCAVYVAHGDGDYKGLLKTKEVAQDADFFTGNSASILASRISYLLNLRGPAITIDTACSSSLVAIHLACESIRSGASELAIAGGVSLTTTPDLYILASNTNMLSPQGQCKAFDDSANGFVPAEGVGVVVLKSLSKAIEDGDNIRAVIKSSGINQDGATNGITAPNSLSQQDLELEVYKKAGISPATISYVEAHGTGTVLGDPIEVQALTNAFREYTDTKQFCAIGSVKTNIGHAQLASGMMGLIKVLLCMEHRKIPPSLHYNKKNRHIDFDSSPFYVNTELADWEPTNTKRLRAAISAFGFSGTNAHILLEEPPKRKVGVEDDADKPFLIPLSAKTEESLNNVVKELLEWCIQNRSSCKLRDIAYTLLCGRSHHYVRTAIVASDCDDLIEKLRNFSSNERPLVKNLKTIQPEPDRKEVYELNESIEAYAKNNSLGLSNDLLNRLANAFISGYSINWTNLFPNKGLKISLPGYPFEKNRHWVSQSVVDNQDLKSKTLHPLVHYNSSTLYEQRFSCDFSGEEYFFRDHTVKGMRVLPGVAYLEMATISANLSSDKKVASISDVIWANPIVSDGEVKNTTHISLLPSQKGVTFSVYSLSSDRQKILHGQGEISLVEVSERSETSDINTIDVNGILARCGKTKSKQEHYSAFLQNQVEHGPKMQAVAELHIGDREAMSHLKLPSGSENEIEIYTLPPVLLDSALQTAIGVAESAVGPNLEQKTYLPFSLGEIRCHKPLEADCYAYARAGTAHPDKDMFYYDIDIVDKHGSILITIRDFSMRAMPAEENKISTMIFEEIWKNEPIPSIDQEADYVVLDLREGENRIVLDGSQGVLWVSSSDEYKNKSERHITLNFGNEEHYNKLLQHIRNLTYVPSKFILILPEGPVPNSVGLEWKSTFDSINLLSKSLLTGAAGYSSNSRNHTPSSLDSIVQILAVYSDSTSAIKCFYGALEGFARSAYLENSKLLIRAVGLTDVESLSEALLNKEQWTVVTNEFSDKTNKYAAVLIKGGDRYVKSLKEIHHADSESSTQLPGFRTRGVYIITGGMGGIGYKVAQYLAQTHRAKLILLGRQNINEGIRNKLNNLKELGAEADYMECNVGAASDVERAVDHTLRLFSEIHGILHCAGVNNDAFIWQKSASDIEKVVAPKVDGVLNLDMATLGCELDYFVLFGSNTAELGNPGQTDYTYANSFMSYFSKWRNIQNSKGLRYGRTLCINWPLWEGGGMGIDSQTLEAFKQSVGLEPMLMEEGFKFLSELLGSELSSYTLIRGDRTKVLNRFINDKDSKTFSRSTGISGENVNTRVNQQLEKVFTKVVSELMSVQPKDVLLGKEMSEYGFNSLTLTELSNAINKQLGLSLLPSIFFEYPTLEALITHVVDCYGSSISINGEAVVDGRGESDETSGTSDTDSPFRTLGHDSSNLKTIDQGLEHDNSNDIAIIGISGMLPQSNDLHEFWENLVKQRDLVTEIPPDRWDWRAIWGDPRKEDGKTNIKWGAFIDNVDKFDAFFFNISAREAELMDPQQRLFLQAVWHAIEDAGYRASSVSGSRMGVFAGVSTSDYTALLSKNGVKIDAYTSTGMAHSVLANRVSHFFNFTGPSEPIDTACSSALVAMNRAVESIQSGSCDTAIVGGVNVMVSEEMYIGFGKAGMLSPDGRSKTFDASANGYARGEGIGAMFLKPLAKAKTDGDHIYAVIRGIQVNHGGKANSLTAPNPNAQADLIVRTVEDAQIDPSTIGYIEAHGTGTSLGDPVEINGLKKAFNRLYKLHPSENNEKHRLGVGSVKTNLGHLEAAAGIAGIFKVLMAIQNRVLPGNVHFNKLNPMIKLENGPLYIVDKTRPWPALQDRNNNVLPRRAGVSSFGFGGANAHVLLEEYVAPAKKIIEKTEPLLFVLSAKTEEQLADYAILLKKFIERRREDNRKASASAGVSPNEIKAYVSRYLIVLVARILDVSASDVEGDISIQDIGIDTHKLAVMTQELCDYYDIDVSLLGKVKYSTSITDITEYLVEHYFSELVSKFGERRADPLDEIVLSYDALFDIAGTLHLGREPMQARLAIVADSDRILLSLLREYCSPSRGTDLVDGIYQGTTQNGGEKNSIDEEQITRWVEQRDFDNLARSWVSGSKIEWSELYNARKVYRVPLPVYPFARDRYWVPGLDSIDHDVIHPLVDAALDNAEDIQFVKRFTLNDQIIKDHCIAGNNILPGVGYIEMALLATQLSTPNQATQIRNVMWAAPVQVNESEKDVYVNLSMQDGAYKFDILSKDNDKNISHSNGRVVVDPIRATEKHYCEPVQYNIDELIKGSIGVREHEQVYEDYSRGGFSYGPSLKVIETIHSALDYSVAKLSLPNQFRSEFEKYRLHPSLMDGALQTIMGIGDESAKEEEDVYIPFSLDQLDIFQPLEPEIYVYARLSKNSNTSKKGIRKFDVSLLNSHGDELVRFTKFTSRAIPQANKSLSTPKVEKSTLQRSREEPELQFYQQSWVEQPVIQRSDQTIGRIIVFSDEFTSEQLSNSLRQDVIKVSSAREFAKIDRCNYEINPRDEDHYSKLINDLRNEDGSPLSFVHLWMLESKISAELNTTSLDASLGCGFYSLVNLFRSLTELSSRSERQRVLIVQPGDIYHETPEYNLVGGLAASSAQVNHRIEFITLHIPAGPRFANSIDGYLPSIGSELSSPDNRHKNEICYTNGIRYVRKVKRWWQDESKVERRINIRNNGKYLVTGGFGSIGKKFVKELCAKHKANVIITARSPMDDAKEKIIHELSKQGGSITFVQSNISDANQVDELGHFIKERFGDLNGIFHIAGVVDDAILTNSTHQEIESTLHPKVHGLVNLDAMSRNFSIDCLVLFSSISSVIGDFGGCSYAAANLFMDRFANYRNRLEKARARSGHTISISWPLWAGGSMELPPDEVDRYFDYSGMVPLSLPHGLEAFDTIQFYDGDHIVVAAGDETKIQKLLSVDKDSAEISEVDSKYGSKEEENTKDNIGEASSIEFTSELSDKKDIQQRGMVSMSISHDDLVVKAEAWLKKLMAKATKIPEKKIDAKTDLEQYGIDSILIMDLNNLLEEQFSELPRTLFFEYSNLNSLAEYFIEEHYEKLIEAVGVEPKKTIQGSSHERKPEDSSIINARNSIPVMGVTETSDRVSVVNSNAQDHLTSEIKLDKTGNTDEVTDIAVIGLAGRFPQAKNMADFWDNLKEGRDCIEEIPSDRWDLSEYYDKEPNNLGKSISKWGGFINDIDKFDPQFFGITPAIAMTLDPQERLFLETSWEVIEDAGYTPASLTQSNYGESGNDIGVFVGIMYDDYKIIEAEQAMKGSLAMSTYWNSTLANRVSYQFNYNGPSVVVDTACSSSLVAVHQACQSLRSGECRAAIAGGVSLSIHPNKYNRLSFVGMLASDGRCRSFGDGGTGYVPGEGVGAVLLKPLAAAEADNDNILAVIKGSTTNHGGKTNGFSVPNPNAQAQLISKALKKTKINPRTISYVEAHGTGTALGDPIEISGLNKSYRLYTKDQQFCSIGSVKSNIGHCEGAAGIAAIAKSVLQLKNRQLVPSLHSNELNSNINFEKSPFYVQQKLSSWQQPVVEIDGESKVFKRTSGVSSFGAGGTNVHVIMQEYEDQRPASMVVNEPQEVLFTISARNEDRLLALVHRWKDYAKNGNSLPPLYDVAYTLQTGRKHLAHRLAIVTSSWQDLVEKLQSFIDDAEMDDVSFFNTENSSSSFDDDDEDREYLENLLMNNRWRKIAKIWLTGSDVEFDRAYARNRPIRVTGLPTYPFAREKHWLPIVEDSPSITPNPPFSKQSKSNSESFSGKPIENTVAAEASVTESAVLEEVGNLELKSEPDTKVNYYRELVNLLKQVLVDVIRLPLSEVGVKQDFYEYGMDSISINQFAKLVNNRFPDVSETALFSYQTIHDLAEYILDNHPEQVASIFGVSRTDEAQTIANNIPTNIDTAVPEQHKTQPQNDFSEKSNHTHDKKPIQNQDLKRSVIEYLKKQLLASCPEISDIPSDENYSSLGIDSIRVKRFIKSVSRQMPGISETALYAFSSVQECAEFMVISNPDLLKLNIDKGVLQVPEENSFAPSPTTEPEESILHDIAIIGLNVRTAHTSSQSDLQDMLERGETSITEAPAVRWEFDRYYSETMNPGKSYCKRGSFLEDYKDFDPLFFGISPFEAQIMDPQERLFLESCWHVVEDAGYTKESLSKGKDVGVFVGVTTPSHNLVGFEEQVAGSDVFTGLSFGSIANRVSFMLNLTGPSLPVDTMCSSSLVSIHLACESIRRGECHAAIAGGVNMYLHPSRIVDLCRTKLLSSKESSCSFVEGGDGFVPSEAVGSVLLKPLDLAKKDGDHIYGVIKGSAIGHTGRTGAYFSPSLKSQVNVIESALRDAGKMPEEVDYIEAHAIGSEMTDAVELEALRQGYRTSERETPLRIGSIKPNIGHAESASGITQLAKVLLQYKSKEYFPTIVHGEVTNKIDLAKHKLSIQRSSESWDLDSKICSGISSFGAGGMSAHLVIEEYRYDRDSSAFNDKQTGDPALVILSAKHPASLLLQSKHLLSYLKRSRSSSENDKDRNIVTLENIAYTLMVGRETMKHRLAIVCHSLQELSTKLEQFVDGNYEERDIFVSKEETNAFFQDDSAVAVLCEGKHYTALAQLWVNGMDIEWNQLFSESGFRRIPLPGYVFDKRECWPNINKQDISDVPLIPSENIRSVSKNNRLENISDERNSVKSAHVSLPTFNQNSIEKKLSGVEKWKSGMSPFLALSLLKYIHERGVFVNTETLSFEEVLEKLEVNVDHNRIIKEILKLLVSNDLITFESGCYRTTRASSVNIKEEIRTLESQMERLFRAVPEFEPIVRYFKYCTESYSTLFSQGSTESIARVIPTEGEVVDQLENLLKGEHRISRIVGEVVESSLKRNISRETQAYRILRIGSGSLSSSISVLDFAKSKGFTEPHYYVEENGSLVDERCCGILSRHDPSVQIHKFTDLTDLEGIEFDVVFLHYSSVLSELEEKIVDSILSYVGEHSLVFVCDPLEKEFFKFTLGSVDKKWSFEGDSTSILVSNIEQNLSGNGYYIDNRYSPWLSVYSKSLAPVLSLPLGNQESEHDNHEKIMGQLTNIICENLGYSSSDITVDTDLTQLGINSVMQAMLLIQIQKSFGTELTAQKVSECKTIRDMSTVVEKLSAPHTTSNLIVDEVEYAADLDMKRETYESSRGQTIEYYTVGQGKPILFLTALAFNKSIWEHQISAFKGEYQLIFPHLPGHEGSSFHGKIFSFEDLADDIAELLDHMNLSATHMVGWCMAGNIAQIFALRHPQRLDSLCLLCTTPTDARTRGMGSGILTDYSNDPLEAYELEFQNIYSDEYFDNPEIASYLDIIKRSHAPVETHALACLLNNLFSFNTQDRLKELSTRVLVVCGKWDIAFPSEQVKILADNITDSEYLEFTRGGHLPFLNQAMTFNEQYLEFLESCDPSDRTGNKNQTHG